jgi:hypothetical protein
MKMLGVGFCSSMSSLGGLTLLSSFCPESFRSQGVRLSYVKECVEETFLKKR